ncbi:MAG: FAD-binding oxidoreductase [Nocardioides sp.]|nr:FAD-binding oxidoreductase [Nocardioides sp.]
MSPDLDWQSLRRRLTGDLFTPDSPGYDLARTPPIALFQDVRPAAVVRPRSEADVVAALSFATTAGVATVVRSGGHSFDGLSSTRGLLVDLSSMDDVELQGEVATIGAGARLGQVYDALDDHGLTIAAGCGPTVGIGGLTLGGGLGILGRVHGLTCDQLRGARVVLADGHVVECDEHREPDLFWAARGGGSLGVVTRLEMQTLPTPETTIFRLTWPASAIPDLISGWQRWAPDAPDELSASLLVTAGPDPDLPPTPHVFGALQGDRQWAQDLLEILVAGVGVPPATRTSHTVPYRSAKQRLVEIGDEFAVAAHGSDAERRHGYHKSEYFDRLLPDAAIEAASALLTERPTGVGCELDLMPWGGGYNRVDPGATAFVHRTDRFLVRYAVSVTPSAADGERAEARDWLERLWQTLHPHGTGRAYQNFPDSTLDHEQRAYYGGNLGRLEDVRAAYDPDRLLTPTR